MGLFNLHLKFQIKILKILNIIKNTTGYTHLEVSEPKWVNPVLNIIEINSLRLGGIHLFYSFSTELTLNKLPHTSKLQNRFIGCQAYSLKQIKKWNIFDDSNVKKREQPYDIYF